MLDFHSMHLNLLSDNYNSKLAVEGIISHWKKYSLFRNKHFTFTREIEYSLVLTFPPPILP